MDKEIFSTEIELHSYGQCSHCKGGEDEVGMPVIRLKDKTNGNILLCRDCIGFYHIHVNAEPYLKNVKEDGAAVERIRKEWGARAKVRQPRDPMLPPRPTPKPRPTKAEEEHMNDVVSQCPSSSLLAVVVGLLMLDKTRKLSFERTTTHGDMSVTERFEIRDE